MFYTSALAYGASNQIGANGFTVELTVLELNSPSPDKEYRGATTGDHGVKAP